MSDGFQIGRIAGIRISIHWSWLVVFVLIIWTLAYSVFPSYGIPVVPERIVTS